ncbi:hypothetical protein OHA72_42460 [Dactylosporangium sp. NBC_01737]|uniref:hypothetical protein n=1 Tax=Dactylosporangium sp. NBC_01737 TaxID=2975959 RepID=UPI002E0F887A|nr:hypothetical protein OHA72_42460 [Dactylosporangium sp. NBC_01737]
MFGPFENPVNPFPAADERPLPGDVRRFVVEVFRPLRPVVVAAVATTVLCAAIEVWLVGYAGRLVDTLAAGRPGTR